jgi:hypothetical protein
MNPEDETGYKKSSFSGNGGCVEVKKLKNGAKLRDTKDRSKPAHEYSREDWELLLDAVRGGAYDLPESDL